MINDAQVASRPISSMPAHDPNHQLKVADPDQGERRRVSIHNNDTILVSGAQTAERYCL